MAVAQRRGVGRLSAGAQHGARDAQRAVRPGLLRHRLDRHALRRRAATKRPRRAHGDHARRLPGDHLQENGQPAGHQRRRGGALGRREPRTGRPDAPLRRRAGHGVPDPGRHPRLHARRRDGQAVEQRPARTQDHAAAAAAARPCRRGAARRAARPAGTLPRGRSGRSTPCNRPSRSREACRRRRK